MTTAELHLDNVTRGVEASVEFDKKDLREYIGDFVSHAVDVAKNYDACATLLAYLVASRENGEFEFTDGQFDNSSFELRIVTRGNKIVYQARFKE